MDQLVGWLNENRVTVKGHPLLLLSRAATPYWALQVGQRSYAAYRELVVDRTYDLVRRFRGTMDVFDAVNEVQDWARTFDFAEEQLIELGALVCDVAREANPEAVRVVNALWPWASHAGNTSRRPQIAGQLGSSAAYLRACLEAGIGFEALGLQLHNPMHDMFEIDCMLERFARFGKPIHITELGVPSVPIAPTPDPSTGVNPWGHPHYWHEPFNEDVHAEWYEQFCTLCYSKPYVTAVTNWLWEDCGSAQGLMTLLARERGERPRGWPPYTGFVHSDLTPKRSFERLEGLVRGWNQGADRCGAG